MGVKPVHSAHSLCTNYGTGIETGPVRLDRPYTIAAMSIQFKSLDPMQTTCIENEKRIPTAASCESKNSKWPPMAAYYDWLLLCVLCTYSSYWGRKFHLELAVLGPRRRSGTSWKLALKHLPGCFRDCGSHFCFTPISVTKNYSTRY